MAAAAADRLREALLALRLLRYPLEKSSGHHVILLLDLARA